jgi:hypothetical protein
MVSAIDRRATRFIRRDRIRLDRGVAGALGQAIAPDQRNQSQV